MSLDHLTILGLFERDDISFDFSRTPTFIVGPNGTGKSTSLRILNYLLTGQWKRLSELPFVALEMGISGQSHIIEKRDFPAIARLRSSFSRSLRRTGGTFLFPTKLENALRLSQPPTIRFGSARPTSQREVPLPDNYLDLAAVHNFVESESRGRVLYYPTYRRVERDLSELFDMETDFEDEPTDLTPSIAQRFSMYGEVVGFGGQDIKSLLNDAASKIENEARQALNEHSVRFLEAVARPRGESTAGMRRLVTNPEKMEVLVRRIRAFAPRSIDMDQIEKGINSLREKLEKKGMGRLTAREDILLFYLGELMKLTTRIDILSSDLRSFADLANTYFTPQKKVTLNDFDNTILITDKSDDEISLDDLSSGEKQILAIFAFLLLSESERGKFLIIDEPELSLSVGWQKTLIADIMKTRRPMVMVAATHSPFIIENFRLENVISLGDL